MFIDVGEQEIFELSLDGSSWGFLDNPITQRFVLHVAKIVK
jgi:hypothetical protein